MRMTSSYKATIATVPIPLASTSDTIATPGFAYGAMLIE